MTDKIASALRIAAKSVEVPTEAQKEAGNYKKGHVRLHGLDISIENPKGSERSGIDKGGKRWSVKMPAHYGYVKGTEGKDGDHVDVYIGPDANSQKVFVIDQVDASTGKFDEHKCCLGYATKADALADYEKAFSDGKAKDRIGSVRSLAIGDFKQWLRNGDTTTPMGDRKEFASGGRVEAALRIARASGGATNNAFIRWMREQAERIPQVEADDTTATSGILSRLGRTATALPKAGINTMANWLESGGRAWKGESAAPVDTMPGQGYSMGVSGLGPEDTIAPLGLAGMGMALKPANALAVPSIKDSAKARYLEWRYPDDGAVTGGGPSRVETIMRGVEGPRLYDPDLSDARIDAMWDAADNMGKNSGVRPAGQGAASPEEYYRQTRWARPRNEVANEAGQPKDRFRLLAENSKSSLLGTIVNAVDDGRGLSKPLPAAADGGRPIRAYHGTGGELKGSAFDLDHPKTTGGGLNKYGVSASPDPNVAARYAMDFHGENSPNVLPLDFTLQKPLNLSASQFEKLQSLTSKFDRGEALSEFDRISLEDIIGPAYKDGMHPIDALRAAGFDGLTKDRGKWGVAEPEVFALGRGTVRSATTGETLFADQAKGSATGAFINAAGESTRQQARAHPSSPESMTPHQFSEAARRGVIGPADLPQAYKAATGREFSRLDHGDIPNDPIRNADPALGGIDNGLRYGYRPEDMAAYVAHNWALRNNSEYKAAVYRYHHDRAMRAWGPDWRARLPDSEIARMDAAAPPGSYNGSRLKADLEKFDFGSTPVKRPAASDADIRSAYQAMHDARDVITRQQAKALDSAPHVAHDSAEPSGIRAYHGSPHDFDEFVTPAFFHKNEGHAKRYRDDGGGMDDLNALGHSDVPDGYYWARKALTSAGDDKERAIKILKRDVQTYSTPRPDYFEERGLMDVVFGRPAQLKPDKQDFMERQRAASQSGLDYLQSGKPLGSMYEVELPRPTAHYDGNQLSNIVDAAAKGHKVITWGSTGEIIALDRNVIKILRKYGWVPIGMAGGGMMMAPPQQQSSGGAVTSMSDKVAKALRTARRGFADGGDIGDRDFYGPTSPDNIPRLPSGFADLSQSPAFGKVGPAEGAKMFALENAPDAAMLAAGPVGRALRTALTYAPKASAAALGAVGSVLPSQAGSAPSEQVRQLQILLRDLGYYKGKIDGEMGIATREANDAYQADLRAKEAQSIERARIEADAAKAGAASAETERLQREAAEATRRREEGEARLRSIEEDVPAWRRILRDYGSMAGLGAGFIAGLGTKGLVNKGADALSRMRAARADELMGQAAKSDLPSRVSRVNQFWSEGGAKGVPFTRAPGALPPFKANQGAPGAETLYQPSALKNLRTDLGVAGLFGVDAALGHGYVKPTAKAELDESRAAMEANPSEANIARYQAAKDKMAIADFMTNMGQAGGVTYLGAGVKMHRKPSRPNVSAAEAERMRVDQLLARGANRPGGPPSPTVPTGGLGQRGPASNTTEAASQSATMGTRGPAETALPATSQMQSTASVSPGPEIHILRRGKSGKTVHGKGGKFTSERSIRERHSKSKDDDEPFAYGGAVRSALRIARKYGGAVKSGLLHSDVPGRTDKLPLDVKRGSYVIPADCVSALGEGNTMAGAKKIDEMVRSRGKQKLAVGGAVDNVPILAAGGEYLIEPEHVAALGGGDVDRGHAWLDDFVRGVRSNTIRTLADLPGPSK